MRNDFCVFILSYGRANNIKTLKALKESGYTGKYYIVIGNDDKQANEYKMLYGKKVIVFDKNEVAHKTDSADNFSDRRVVLYARNACFDIAKKLGYKYFLELDDDYTSFMFRYVENKKMKYVLCKDLNKACDIMINFLKNTNALTVAFAQGGDLIGGKDSGNFKKGILRKAMNTFFCCTERPFLFIGRVNEDVNTYVNYGSKGELFFTLTALNITQAQTQQQKGGMTEMYLESGTYIKSFYTVMYNPSSVKIQTMGAKHKRIHHRIDWETTVPKIIEEKYKK